MCDATIATKLLGQLKAFLGRISPHFRKPVARFIGDMMYGIMAEKDVKLSSIVRALKEHYVRSWKRSLSSLRYMRSFRWASYIVSSLCLGKSKRAAREESPDGLP